MGEYRQYNTLDLERAYIGQALDLPYEVTVGEGWRELWSSCFYSPSRVYSSDVFAQKLGFKSQLLPFGFLFNQAVGMSHVDETREVLDLGFSEGVYVTPAFSGQTFNKQFVIKRLRASSSGQDTIVTFQCNLLDAQTKDLIFTVDKTMLFRGLVNPRAQSVEPTAGTRQVTQSLVYDQIREHASSLPGQTSTTPLHAGQLLLHGIARPIGRSNSMSLSSLFGMTHPSIFNHALYQDEGLIVPGALVVSMAMSAASRELSEVLYHALITTQFYNKTNPLDTVGAMTFIHSVKEVDTQLEQLVATTVGIKNVDMIALADVEFPQELFTGTHTNKEMERLCQEHIPQLSGKILLTARRRLLRQTASQGYSMPLL